MDLVISEGCIENPPKRYQRVAPLIFCTKGFGMSIPRSKITITK
ncbi:hypothetical protein NT05LI_3294 [Listeria ivanovii FSL F6-596]|nr:hypothetical protein NT05LI_3294 [Listeria ivanovii FSL F6-596]